MWWSPETWQQPLDHPSLLFDKGEIVFRGLLQTYLEVRVTENLQRKLASELLSGDEKAVTREVGVLGQITDQSCLQVTRATFVPQTLFVVPPWSPGESTAATGRLSQWG